MGTGTQVDVNTDPPSVNKELVRELLQELDPYLDPYRLMGPNNIQPRVLRELVDIITRSLSIIFGKSQRLGDVPEDRKKANVSFICTKSLKEDSGNYRPISLISVPGKVMECILLGAVTSQLKHVIENSQHRFTRSKSCLTNLIAFYDKVTCSVDIGQAGDVVY